MAGLFSNPANWKIVDTLQGQEGGFDLDPFNVNIGASPNQAGGQFPLTTTPQTTPYVAPGSGATGTIGAPAPTGGEVLGSGTSAGGSAAPTVNPILGQVDQARNTLYDTSLEAARQFVPNFQFGVGTSRTNLTESQDALNESAIQAELGKRQANADILSMVGRGIRSGGVILGNRNASDSSAAGELARAYGQIGQRESGDVAQQYGLEVRDLAQQQGQLNVRKNEETERLKLAVENEKNRILNAATAELQALNDQLAGAGVADRIAIEQEKQRIKDGIMGELGELDAFITSQLNVQPQSQEQAQAAAGGLYTAGAGQGTQFDFNTQAPASFTGANPGQLPIFTSRALRRREE